MERFGWHRIPTLYQIACLGSRHDFLGCFPNASAWLCVEQSRPKNMLNQLNTHIFTQNLDLDPTNSKRSSKIRLPIGLPCCAVLCSAFPTAAAEAKAIAEAEAAKEKEAAEAKCFPKQDVFYTAQQSTTDSIFSEL